MYKQDLALNNQLGLICRKTTYQNSGYTRIYVIYFRDSGFILVIFIIDLQNRSTSNTSNLFSWILTTKIEYVFTQPLCTSRIQLKFSF